MSENRYKMDFISFKNTFQPYAVFSKKDIEKQFPAFNAKNLINWQDKNYVQKIRNGWYRFSDTPLSIETLFGLSNRIYAPSYISVESALSHYGLIPEGVFTVTAVSTLKTQVFATPVGSFQFQNLKPSLYFGYKLLPTGNSFFKIADLEKTLLDYFYLKTDLETDNHLEGLRLNTVEIQQNLDIEKFKTYLEHFDSKALNRRVKLFLNFINR